VLHVTLVLPPVNCIYENRVTERVGAAMTFLTYTRGYWVRISAEAPAAPSEVFYVYFSSVPQYSMSIVPPICHVRFFRNSNLCFVCPSTLLDEAIECHETAHQKENLVSKMYRFMMTQVL
jgi:hypothetical protein